MNPILAASETVSVTSEALKIAIPAIISPIILAAISLLSAQIRSALLYKRTEYDFEYLRDTNEGPATWDIQWEGFRLTIKANDISNDEVKEVTFIKDKEPPGETITLMRASEEFRPLFEKQLYVKLNSIIRFTPNKGEKKYILRFVLRRRLYR